MEAAIATVQPTVSKTEIVEVISDNLIVKTEEESAVTESTLPKLEIVSDPQTELGLTEPPAVIESKPMPDGWANSISESQLQQWWTEFGETQTQGVASFLNTLKPTIVQGEVCITILAIKEEMVEKMRYPFNRFIQEKSDGRLSKLQIRIGEPEKVERRPYTDKEKLEYLVNKHPKIADVMDKLKLKLL